MQKAAVAVMISLILTTRLVASDAHTFEKTWQSGDDLHASFTVSEPQWKTLGKFYPNERATRDGLMADCLSTLMLMVWKSESRDAVISSGGFAVVEIKMYDGKSMHTRINLENFFGELIRIMRAAKKENKQIQSLHKTFFEICLPMLEVKKKDGSWAKQS